MPKKIFTQKVEGTRRRGRLRKRWKEEVERDLQVLGVRRWRELVADRKKWKDIVRQAKAHSGLLCQWKKNILKPYCSVVYFRKESSGRATYALVGNAVLYFAGNIYQSVREDIQNKTSYVSVKHNHLFLFNYSYTFRSAKTVNSSPLHYFKSKVKQCKVRQI